MSRPVMAWLVLVLALPLAACAGGGGTMAGGGDANVTGDENGGRIADAIGGPAQARAMQTVNEYCARFDKRGYVTRMDYDSRTITFECRRQRPG